MPGPERDLEMEKVVNAMKIAVTNMRVFSEGSTVITETIQKAQTVLAEFLKTHPQAILSNRENVLWANRTHIVAIPGFVDYMNQRAIRTIIFSPGITTKELLILMQVLAKPKGELSSFKEVQDFVVSRSVTHIELDDVILLNPHEEEKLVSRIRSTMGSSTAPGTGGGLPGAASVPQLLDTLRGTLAQLQANPDSASRAQITQNLVHQLKTRAPEEIHALFTSPEAKSGDTAAMLDQFTQSLDQTKVEEMIRYAAQWQQHFKVTTRSDEQARAHLESLKSLMSRIMQSPAGQNISPEMYAYLRRLGLLEHVSGEGMASGESFSFVAVAENLLQLPCDYLLGPALREGFLNVLKIHCTKGEDQTVLKLIAKVMENLARDAIDSRALTVGMLQDIQNILQMHRKADISRRVTAVFLELLEKEDNPQNYARLAHALQNDSSDHLAAGRFGEAASLLSQLRIHALSKASSFPTRHSLAEAALKVFAEKSMDMMANDLSGVNDERRQGALLILPHLGNSAVDPLFESVRRARDPRVMFGIAQALERLGQSAKASIVQQLKVTATADSLMRLLIVLELFMDSTTAAPLSALLGHADASIRRKVLKLLGQLNVSSSEDLLRLLNDPDIEMQKIVVQRLGDIRLEKSVKPLIKKFAVAVPPVQEEICKVLGVIGDEEAVKLLGSCVVGPRFFWQKKELPVPSVRVQAVQSLKRLSQYPYARKCLCAAARDKSEVVRQAAA